MKKILYNFKDKQIEKEFLSLAMPRAEAASLEINETMLSESLFISDNDEMLRWAQQHGMAVLGVEGEGLPRLNVPQYIVGDCQEIDEKYLDQVYCRAKNLPWYIATTPRIILRETILDDFDALHTLYAGHNLKWFDSRAELEHYRKAMYGFYQYGLWSVLERSTGSVIGHVGLQNRLQAEEEVVELGYMIGRQYQQQGFAWEAAHAVLAYAFDEMGLDEVHIFVEKHNDRSYRLAKSLQAVVKQRLSIHLV